MTLTVDPVDEKLKRILLFIYYTYCYQASGLRREFSEWEIGLKAMEEIGRASRARKEEAKMKRKKT